MTPIKRAIIHCPDCDGQHVDRDEWATKPHRRHLCEHCGSIFRPEGALGRGCSVGVENE